MLQLSEDGPEEEPSADDILASLNVWELPTKLFDGLWERFVLLSSLVQSVAYYTKLVSSIGC
jgi:hypothetical protein